MALENPFFKAQASKINLDVNLPQTRDLGLTSLDRINDPLRQGESKRGLQGKTDEELQIGFEEWKAKNNANTDVSLDAEAPNDQNLREARIGRRSDRLSDRIDKAADSGDTELADRLAKKLEANSGKLSSGDGSKRGSGRFGGVAATGAVTALGEAPNIINNLNTTPETSEAATGKVLSMASSGASIGMAAGPWGALIGGAIGAGAGIVSNANWRGKLVAQNDDKLTDKLNAGQAERQQNFFMNKTADQIQAEMNIFKESQGLLS